MHEPPLWAAPSPLWGRFGGAPDSAAALLSEDQARPALLRFASDEFMEQLLATLAADPRQLDGLVARPETWRTPSAPGADLVERVRLPKLALSLARLRKSSQPPAAVGGMRHEAATQENGVERSVPLKLYQPAHQRHYLVAASLVCGSFGLPDRVLSTTREEQAAFVLRRLLPVAGSKLADPPREEYAFVKDAQGSRWQRIAPELVGAMPEGEELLPLFPLNFADDAAHPRRLLAGVVPVGRREEYMGTRAQAEASLPGQSGGGVAAQPSVVAARKEQLKMEVAEPWKNVLRVAYRAAAAAKEGVADAPDLVARQKTERRANNQAQGASWLVLLDFADYLRQHLNPVWQCVLDPTQRSRLTSAAQRRLFDWLDAPATAIDTALLVGANDRPFAATLRDALARVAGDDARRGLEQALRPFPESLAAEGLAWPGFFYPLAWVHNESAAGVHQSLASDTALAADPNDVEATPPLKASDVEAQALVLDKLVQLVVQAIDTAAPAQPAPPLPFAAQLRDALATTQGDAGWFCLRCVHLSPECLPRHPALLSAPSCRFQLASFFDADAPARPIRIALPLDSTSAGLRKHNKNTAFVISDVLCGQIQRAKGLGLVDLVRAVLPWPLHKDLDVDGMGPCQSSASANIGMICSLSIPIITICALILLMIIVSLLDMIFRWLPWFVMCFPIPGLKGKK